MDKEEMRVPLSGQPTKDPLDRAVAQMERGTEDARSRGVEVVATAEGAGEDKDALEAAAEVARGAQASAQAKTAEATRRAERGKESLADSVASVAGLLHQAGMSLQEQDQATVARLVHEAADGLDRLHATLREGDVEQLLAQARDYARAKPGMVIGGSLVAGFLLSRLLTPRRD
jgi:hypothetical protein